MASTPQNLVSWPQLASNLSYDSMASSNLPSFESSNFSIGSFTEILAPLNQGTYQEVIGQVKEQLELMNQTLAMLEGQTFDAILQDILKACAFKVGEMLNADRTTVFLADKERQELWSTVAKTEEPNSRFEIRLPWNQGIAGQVARTRQSVNVPFDFYEDPRSQAAKKLDAQTGYRTYMLLALPLLDSKGDLIAVIELINKCRSEAVSDLPLSERIDLDGFGAKDEAAFAEIADVFRLILESSKAFYLASRRQKATTALVKATQALNHTDSKLDNTLQRVMKEAQNLLDADRSTVWILDHDHSSLWAKIPFMNGRLEEVRLPVGEGYVGRVAETGLPLNIPCDLYRRSDSEVAQRTDQRSGYRTYSLLCIPVFNTAGKLIAVTQLVNKYRPGSPKSPVTIDPEKQRIPDCFQASFNQDDEFFMLAFNIHAGVAIERALMYDSLEAKVIDRTQELELKNQQLQYEIAERIQAQQELSELNQKLAKIARIDSLTQVSNRRNFDEQIDVEWRRMRRMQAPLSLILCDIDFFKRYNDLYGHPAGDECLKKVATAMLKNIRRSGDLLARYGGEEFVAILPDTDAKGSFFVAESMRQAILDLALPHEGSEISNFLTLSLGVITCIPNSAYTQHDLIQNADQALYRAKKQGRNCVVVGRLSRKY